MAKRRGAESASRNKTQEESWRRVEADRRGVEAVDSSEEVCGAVALATLSRKSARVQRQGFLRCADGVRA